MLTDHARRERVKKYAVVLFEEKRRLLKGEYRLYSIIC
jgi:hypothetical protein